MCEYTHPMVLFSYTFSKSYSDLSMFDLYRSKRLIFLAIRKKYTDRCISVAAHYSVDLLKFFEICTISAPFNLGHRKPLVSLGLRKSGPNVTHRHYWPQSTFRASKYARFGGLAAQLTQCITCRHQNDVLSDPTAGRDERLNFGFFS